MVRELFRSSARTSEGPDGRHWEIDALRGLAVVMMVVYHLMYDLYYFKVSDAIFTNRFWFYFQRTTASLFVILMGISLTLNYSRSLQQGREVRYRTFLRARGATLRLGAGHHRSDLARAGTWRWPSVSASCILWASPS